MRAVDEEELVERLVPRIEERIRCKIVRGIINALKEEFYPPEKDMR